MELLTPVSLALLSLFFAALLVCVCKAGRDEDRCEHGVSYHGICVECEEQAEEEWRSRRIDDPDGGGRCAHGVPRASLCFLCSKDSYDGRW